MTSAVIAGFNALVIISFLFGLLVLSTAILSSKVQRRPPRWYGFLVPVFLYDIVLMLSMGFQTSTGPPLGLCAFQALLLYSIPGWVVVAFGCFMIEFYIELKHMVRREEDEDAMPYTLSKRAKIVLIGTPLAAFVMFLLINGLFVHLSSEKIPVALNTYKLYCTPKIRTGLYVGGAIMCIVMLIWVFVMLKMGILLKRHYIQLRGSPEIICRQVFSVYIRATAIFVASSVVIGFYISSMATGNADNLLSSYCLSLPTIIIFTVFGTQRDILNAWAFWRKRPDSQIDDQISLSEPVSPGAKPTSVWRQMGYNWNLGTATQTITSFHTSSQP